MNALLDLYKTLSVDNLHRLRDVYRDDIRFVDPAHEINGIENLIVYFDNLYRNAQSVSFSFEEPMVSNTLGYVRWQMRFAHKSLAGGRSVEVDGVTYVEMDEDGKVYYHRDYFDLGAMIYEHVTLLGKFIRIIRKRLGQ